jgi:hypothetical protein
MMAHVRAAFRREDPGALLAVGLVLSVAGLVTAGDLTGQGIGLIVGGAVQVVGVGTMVGTAVWSDIWG